jgi:hypothetical protein
LYYYGARWYDTSLGRFAQADSIIPGIGNPLAYDRYSYTLNNPLKYSDPTGHDPIVDFLLGAGMEIERTSLWFHPQAQKDLSVKEDESTAMLVGRLVGDVISAGIAMAEIDAGSGAAGGGVVACATGVGCLAGGGAVVVAGGAAILQGAGTGVQAAVGAGKVLAMLADTEGHHIATNKNFVRGPQWSNKFKNDIFDPAGMDLDDPANIVDLPDHEGPHPQSYHQWVYNRLSNAIKGIDGQSKIYNALKSELQNIGGELLKNPSLLHGPR